LGAFLQASGEAKYTSDLHMPNLHLGKPMARPGGAAQETCMSAKRPCIPGKEPYISAKEPYMAVPSETACYGAFVSTGGNTSGRALASIDTTEAAKCPGYITILTADDFPNMQANRNVVNIYMCMSMC